MFLRYGSQPPETRTTNININFLSGKNFVGILNVSLDSQDKLKKMFTYSRRSNKNISLIISKANTSAKHIMTKIVFVKIIGAAVDSPISFIFAKEIS